MPILIIIVIYYNNTRVILHDNETTIFGYTTLYTALVIKSQDNKDGICQEGDIDVTYHYSQIKLMAAYCLKLLIQYEHFFL